ncbi:MAG: gamma-glutamyl-gamma-aminobutyrate hydrolase family protein, partial [Myxococcota bacterium]
VILPPGEPEPGRLLDFVDALVLSGGGDIHAGAYGARPHETAYNVSRERDGFEFALARAALERGDRPILCICRGMQVLNVVCGGTLHGHIPDNFGEQVTHRLPPRLPVRHGARVEAGTRLADILGGTRVEVCSWHHQAIDRIGKNLRPVGFAEDGIIEAVEHTGHPWCLGVQWHPEMQGDEAPHRRLFSALLAAIDDIREGSDGRTAG